MCKRSLTVVYKSEGANKIKYISKMFSFSSSLHCLKQSSQLNKFRWISCLELMPINSIKKSTRSSSFFITAALFWKVAAPWQTYQRRTLAFFNLQKTNVENKKYALHKNHFACLFSVHNKVSLPCHKQVCLLGLMQVSCLFNASFWRTRI